MAKRVGIMQTWSWSVPERKLEKKNQTTRNEDMTTGFTWLHFSLDSNWTYDKVVYLINLYRDSPVFRDSRRILRNHAKF